MLVVNMDREVHVQVMMTSSNGKIFRVSGPLCRNSPFTGEFPSQRPVTQNFDVSDLRLNKRLSKQPRSLWFETRSRSIWRHCYVLRHIQDSSVVWAVSSASVMSSRRGANVGSTYIAVWDNGHRKGWKAHRMCIAVIMSGHPRSYN